MSSFNKIITNMPVSLNETEISNLSNTLSGIIQGGGGGETKRYVGDGVYVTINNDVNPSLVTLTQTSIEKLDRDIPTKVSDLTDSASYQTTAGMSGYLTTGDAASTYQSKGDYLSANALDNISGTWENVTAKLDTTAFSTVSGNFLTAHQSLANYYQKTETSGASELAAAFGAILNYDVTAAAGIEITTATDNGTTTFGISMTAQPVVTDTNLSGYNGIAAAPDGAKSGWWNVGLTQDMINTINGKLDSSDFTTYTGTTAPNTYLTKTSADTLYQPTGDYVTTADVLTGTSNTLTGIKIGSTDYTIPTTDLSNYYTKTQVDSTFASATQLNDYLTTAQYQTDSAAYAKKTDLEGFVTSSNVTAQDTDYVMTTAGWKVLTLPGGGMTQVIHDATLTGQGNADDSKLGVAWSALSGNVSSKLDTTAAAQTYLTTATYAVDSATFLTKSSADNDYAPISITATVNTLTAASAGWNDKVDKPSSLVDKYLVLRTDTDGNVSGWCDFQDQSYSKAEADRTFVATAYIDTTTLSGNGKSVSTKLGVKTDVIATTDYVNSSFLPTSGGTVSGQLEVHGGSNFDTQFIKLTREGNSCGARIGLGSDTTNGTLALKTFNGQGQNTVQVNIKHNTNNNELIQVQKGGSDVGFLIPAVTATTTADLTNDGILHIILES